MNCHSVFNCVGHNHELSDNRLIKETVLKYVNEAEFKELFTIAALEKIETVTSASIAATSSAIKASLDARNAVNDLTIQTMDFVNDAINNTAVEGGVLADTFVTVTAQQGFPATTQRDLNSHTLLLKKAYAFADEVKVDGVQSSIYLQSLIDKLPDGGVLDLLGRTYTVSKNTGLTGFPKNDQPCLLVRDVDKLVIQNGKLIVKEHGQGVFDVVDSVAEFRNLTIVGAGLFPPLYSNTGRGEKGLPTAGYYYDPFYNGPNAGYPRNNSVNTSGFTTGKMRSDNKFPREDGSTGTTWGMWNGGYIQNFGDGICSNRSVLTVEGCDISGFNGFGVAVYAGSIININKNKFHDLYSGGALVWYDKGFPNLGVDKFNFENNMVTDVGHPDSVKTDVDVDPGYGVSTSRLSEALPGVRSYVVKNNTFIRCKRKAVDAHHLYYGNVSENHIEKCGRGIELTIDKLSGFPDASIVSGNYIKDCLYSTTSDTFAISVSSLQKYELDGGKITDDMTDEQMQRARDTVYRGHAVITGNIIENIGVNIKEFTGLTKRPSIQNIIVQGLESANISNNILRNSRDILGGYGIVNGITHTVQMPYTVITGNTIIGYFGCGIFSYIAASAHFHKYNYSGASIIKSNIVDIKQPAVISSGEVILGIWSDGNDITGNTVIPNQGVTRYQGLAFINNVIQVRIALSTNVIYEVIAPPETLITKDDVTFTQHGNANRCTVDIPKFDGIIKAASVRQLDLAATSTYKKLDMVATPGGGVRGATILSKFSGSGNTAPIDPNESFIKGFIMVTLYLS